MNTILLFLCLLTAESLQFNLIEDDLTKTEPGVWVIDLRPEPNAEPYLKEFEITQVDGNSFSGKFYDTPFEGGLLNENWDQVYFAFSTSDQNSTYFHSGYIDGDEVHGVTYSPERTFVMPWRGTKK